MGGAALAIAVASVAALFVPSAGMYLGLGGGIAAVGLGWTGYRRRQASGPSRLQGAGGVAVGLLAVGLGGAKLALTLGAISAIESAIGK